MSAPAETSTANRHGRLVWKTGVIAAVVALVANVVVYALARLLGSSLETQVPGRVPVQVGLGQIIPITVVPIALGTLLLWILHRRGRAVWSVLAWVGMGLAALSTIGPITAGTTTGSTIALVLMHLLTGASWCVLVLRARATLPPR